MFKFCLIFLVLVKLSYAPVFADLILPGTVVISGQQAKQLWDKIQKVGGQSPTEFKRHSDRKGKYLTADANIQCTQYEGSPEVNCQIVTKKPESKK